MLRKPDRDLLGRIERVRMILEKRERRKAQVHEIGFRELMDEYLEQVEPDIEEEAEPWLLPALDESELRVWRRRAVARETARFDAFLVRARRMGRFGELPDRLMEYGDVLAEALVLEFERECCKPAAGGESEV